MWATFQMVLRLSVLGKGKIPPSGTPVLLRVDAVQLSCLNVVIYFLFYLLPL